MKNKIIVITGAGGVLCSGFAAFLAGKGAKVALLDLNEAAAQAVAEEIRQNGGAAHAYACNVLDRATSRPKTRACPESTRSAALDREIPSILATATSKRLPTNASGAGTIRLITWRPPPAQTVGIRRIAR